MRSLTTRRIILKIQALNDILCIYNTKEGSMMFDVIKSNVTPQQAKEAYLNDYIVLLIVEDSKSDTTGDVIFVGSIANRRKFVKQNNPPDGYTFYMLRGDNLREYCPIIIEELSCYSN